jgi:hypothetical protein
VNLVAEDEYESEEDEEWWVGTVRVEEEEEGEESMEEADDSELEQEEGKARNATCTYMGKNDSGLENESEYFWEVPSPSNPCKREEDRRWSPGPPESSCEEDEEEAKNPPKVLGLKPREGEARKEEPPPPKGSGREPSEAPKGEEPPHTRRNKRRKLRRKVTENEDCQWELVRQGAWLRELLTDSSGSETEEEYDAGFAESGRWIAEMTGISHSTTTTLRGECSRQEKPES